jgi:hypothetical protein
MDTPAGQPEAADPAEDQRTAALLDVALGVAAFAAGTAHAIGRRADSVARPVVRVVMHPPLVSSRYHPATWMAGLADLGSHQRREVEIDLSRLLDRLLPAALEQVLRRVDLTAVVKQHVDLDAVVAEVDLDKAVARVDLDAVARRLDLDAVAGRLDVDAVARRLDVGAVLDQLDLTELVRERVDLNGLVSTVDIDAVAGRLDVDTVARRIDVDAIIDRIDLVGIASDLMIALDLPEIIRDSTASVASDTVRGVRMQGIAADEALGRVRDRLWIRRGRGRTGTPTAGSGAGEAVDMTPGVDAGPIPRQP